MSDPDDTIARLVRLDPLTALCPLFVPLAKKGHRPPLNVQYQSRNGDLALHFSARQALGMPEQTVLLAVLELAAEQYLNRPRELTVINASRAEGLGQYLWRALHDGHSPGSGESLYVQTSWHELMGRCGSRGGRSQELCKAQLMRLSEVTVWVMKGDTRHTFHQTRLISVWHGDDLGVHVAVNVRLAQAVMGGQYAAVSLQERLALKTDTAQAVHAHLSAVVHVGASLKFRVDTLVQRLYPDDAKALMGTRRRRRKLVRDAMEAIGTLPGWTIRWTKSDVALVRRTSGPSDIKRRRDSASGERAVEQILESPMRQVEIRAEEFDATCFLAGVTDSPCSGTFNHKPMDFR